MGLVSCFAPSQQQTSDRLNQEVQELKLALASAQKNVTQLQADRLQLLHDLASRPVTPAKQDAATEIATVSVAVQVKPPVTLESRIPRPTGEDAKEADGSKAPAKTRIPAPPVAVPPAAVADAAAELPIARSPSRGACHSPPRSPTRSALLTDEPAATALRAPSSAAGEAGEASLSAAASPRGGQLAVGTLRAFSISDATALVSPKAAGSEQQGAAAAGSPQRVEVLQQQLKVAEAFRTSLKADLRDERFANTNLQTQMLSLQSKFEKTIEAQLSEVERLIKLRRDGQDAHEQAIQQVHALRHQLELQGHACASAQREAQAAAKHAAEQEQRVQKAEAEVARVSEELASCVAHLEQRSAECSELAEKLQAVQQQAQSADVRVLQLQAVAQQADEGHRAVLKQLEDELRDGKAIYDSTVEGMLQLNNNYNELKQNYHKLQSETRNHDKMVQLVQQELSELSYYAAAGRVALGIAPASTLTNCRTSEVSMGSGGGIPPAAAAAAPAGDEMGSELPPGVSVTHGAVLLSDGRLQLSDGRVIETTNLSEDDDRKVTAAVKAIRALSEDSSDGGLAATEPEAAAEEQAGCASAETGAAVVPTEGEVSEGTRMAGSIQAEEPEDVQQDVLADTTAGPAATATAVTDELAGETCDVEAKA